MSRDVARMSWTVVVWIGSVFLLIEHRDDALSEGLGQAASLLALLIHVRKDGRDDGGEDPVEFVGQSVWAGALTKGEVRAG